MFKISRWKEDARYREYQRSYHKTYRKERRDFLLEYYRTWRTKNVQRMLEYRYGKTLDLTTEQYNKITEKCAICGFNELVHCHHIIPRSMGGKNNKDNLIGLCPNHHFLIHSKKYQLVKENGYFKLTFSNHVEKV